MAEGLTPVQRDLLQFIQRSIEEQGVSPSFREMQAAMGFGGTGAVHRVVEQLQERGYVRRLSKRSRALVVVHEGLYLNDGLSREVARRARQQGLDPAAFLETVVRRYLDLTAPKPRVLS